MVFMRDKAGALAWEEDLLGKIERVYEDVGSK
jgi:hypothetical protein